MSQIIPPGFYQATFIHHFTGRTDEADVVIGFDFTGDPGVSDLLALSVAWRLNMIVPALLTSNVTYDGVRLATGEGTILAQSDSYVAGNTGNPAPPNCAYLARKLTGEPGRTQRGRSYLPGVGETAIDDAGVLTLGTLTALQGALEDFVSDANTAGWTPVLLHSQPGLAPTPFAYSIDTRIATQRKRMRD